MILSLLVVITLMGGVVMVWYTYRMQGLMNRIIDRDLPAFEAAEKLAVDLATQKGFVSYYFIDHNPEWLNKLEEHRRAFRIQIETSRSLAVTEEQKDRKSVV